MKNKNTNKPTKKNKKFGKNKRSNNERFENPNKREKRNFKKENEYTNRFDDDFNDNKKEQDYIFGIHSVREALHGTRSINSILITNKQNRQIYEIMELAKEKKIPVKEVPSSKLNTLCENQNHQGIAAYISPMEYYSLDKLLADDKNSDFIVALDGITDVHNLGAIMRTIEAAGFRYVMIPERRSAQLNSTVAKTSAGAIEFVRTVRVSSLSNSLKELKKNGYWVIGADLSGKTDYLDADYKGKVVVVIGSESKGISPSILKMCDFNVKIPMYGRINSLNASVSASILIYEALKQIQASKK